MIDPKYLKDLTPPRDLLDACFVVHLADPPVPMWKMKKWAREQCQSFI